MCPVNTLLSNIPKLMLDSKPLIIPPTSSPFLSPPPPTPPPIAAVVKRARKQNWSWSWRGGRRGGANPRGVSTSAVFSRHYRSFDTPYPGTQFKRRSSSDHTPSHILLTHSLTHPINCLPNRVHVGFWEAYQSVREDVWRAILTAFCTHRKQHKVIV